jgi:exodeoxyribonuclease-5
MVDFAVLRERCLGAVTVANGEVAELNDENGHSFVAEGKVEVLAASAGGDYTVTSVPGEPDKVLCKSPYGKVVVDMPPTRGFELSEQQNEGLRLIDEWYTSSDKQEFHLGGYAGTGKTVTISELSKRLDTLRIQHEVASFTGKAVSVLKKKGLWQARTLHNLLYKFSYDPIKNKYIMEKQPSLYGAKLVIVDEASMVSTSLYEDLIAHGVKVLFVGDPAQLEPVGDNPNLVRNCDYTFTEIHRQANKSPILRMAQAVRQRSVITPPVGEWVRDCGSLVVTKTMTEIEDKYDVVICGKNATRHNINRLRRQQRGYGEEILYEGETVICLKNDRDRGIFNGMTFKVKALHTSSLFRSREKVIYCDLEDDLGQVKEEVPVSTEFFGKDFKGEDARRLRNVIAFDYGYCLTAHKSQGSEFDNVLVIDEPVYGSDSARWRYTAITRAAKSLTYLL